MGEVMSQNQCFKQYVIYAILPNFNSLLMLMNVYIDDLGMKPSYFCPVPLFIRYPRISPVPGWYVSDVYTDFDLEDKKKIYLTMEQDHLESQLSFGPTIMYCLLLEKRKNKFLSIA